MNDYRWIEEYGKARRRLFIRVRNMEAHKKAVSALPHEEILDLAVTCHVFLEESLRGISSCTVTEDLRGEYGVTAAELIRDATDNAASLCGWQIRPMTEMSAYLTGEDAPALQEGAEEVLVITNRKMLYGAAAVFYPGVAPEIASRLQGSYFLLPSSVHEMIAVPAKDHDPAYLSQMVRTINRTVVDTGDRLSDHVYLYDTETGTFVIAD